MDEVSIQSEIQHCTESNDVDGISYMGRKIRDLPSEVSPVPRLQQRLRQHNNNER